MAPTLGYWKLRGMAEAIRMLLHYKEVEFENKMYEGQDWFDVKFTLGFDFPNLPHYIDGDVKITETSAIFAYLGRKYNLGGSTDEAKLRNDITYSVTLSNRMALVTIVYNPDFEKLKPAFIESLPGRLEKLSAWLGDRDFFGGSEIVYSDFSTYEFLDVLNLLEPGCLEKYKNLVDYMARMEALPTLKKYLESDQYMKRGPLNGYTAQWGATALP